MGLTEDLTFMIYSLLQVVDIVLALNKADFCRLFFAYLRFFVNRFSSVVVLSIIVALSAETLR